MKNNLSKIAIVALLLIAVLCGATSCKSKKKATQTQATTEAQYNSKVRNAKETLKAIINGETEMTTEEKETKLNSIKKENFDDAKLKELITKVEEMIENERAEEASKKPSVKVVDKTTETDNSLLDTLFDKIAAGNDTKKNIATVSEMCESNNIPVLIIISKNGTVTDYDRPTTIGKYLNYLKDQNVSRNKVYKIIRNANNKITEIELIRK